MKNITLATAIAFTLTGTAQAATDGTLGSISSGSVDILIIANELPQGAQIQITGLEDFDFGGIDSGDPMPGPITNSNVCVYGTEIGTYALTLDGSPLSAFNPTDTLTYDVVFTDPVSGSSMNMTTNGPTQNTQGGFITSNTVGCNASDLASLQITLNSSVSLFHPDFGAGNNIYAGTLSLTVAPE